MISDLFLFSELRIKPRALDMLGRWSSPKLHHQIQDLFFLSSSSEFLDIVRPILDMGTRPNVGHSFSFCGEKIRDNLVIVDLSRFQWKPD